MNNGYFTLKKPLNERPMNYRVGCPERDAVMEELERQAAMTIDIPCIIGGKEVRTGNTKACVEPHRHANVLANFHLAGKEELEMAIEAALEAKKTWKNMPWEHRASIFLKAAELLTGPYRTKMAAATMLCQSKNPYEAEIDVVCELADFLRFNAYFLQEIYCTQPESSANVWNRVEYRPLEGFVAAVSPFNFTSIGGNLPTAPAMCGNVVLWKPSSTAVLSNYYFMQILMEAGMPAGVINFVPCNGSDFGKYVVSHRCMAGFHFTGSTEVFQGIWKQVGENITSYKSYPRLVGETGGKDFIFAHKSADLEALICGLVRGAFAYQGQKCSAASRAYIPESLWPAVRERLYEELKDKKPDDVRNPKAFLNAVIDKKSFDHIKEYLDYVKHDPDSEIIEGGNCDDSVGYFVDPTVILAKHDKTRTMVEEIFGPVLTIYVYPDDKLEEIMRSCDKSTGYALTGAIYANDRLAIMEMEKALTNAAGNFYINDKPTGAVVGQQPFGGGRGSGTNDKAGSAVNLYRWVSQRVIKESFVPDKVVLYPHMEE